MIILTHVDPNSVIHPKKYHLKGRGLLQLTNGLVSAILKLLRIAGFKIAPAVQEWDARNVMFVYGCPKLKIIPNRFNHCS